jgi:O-antigen/teichoic acid export membrane protein
VAVLVALRGQRGLVTPGPTAPYSELSNALAWLLVGSIFAQLLSYISVLGVQLLATPQERATITAGFITGIFVARIPLLAFQAIQAALLPKLSGLASEGKHRDFRSGVLRLVAVITSLCVFGTLLATWIGPEIGQRLFPTKWNLGHRDMFMLTAAATIFIFALTLAQALIALKAYKQNAFSWVVGVLTFVVVVAVAAGEDLFLRNEVGFLAGSIVSAVLVGIFLILRMRRAEGSLEDLARVIEHEPLEI